MISSFYLSHGRRDTIQGTSLNRVLSIRPFRRPRKLSASRCVQKDVEGPSSTAPFDGSWSLWKRRFSTYSFILSLTSDCRRLVLRTPNLEAVVSSTPEDIPTTTLEGLNTQGDVPSKKDYFEHRKKKVIVKVA